MPKRNEPSSLKESAMICIARNFDLICYNCRSSEQMKKMIEEETYLDVDGPFQNLPSSLITELMRVIGGTSTIFYIQRKHLHLLLLPHLESLKLSPSSGGNTYGLELIQRRCKFSSAPTLCLGLQDTLQANSGHLRRRHLHAILHKFQEEFSISKVGDTHFCLEILAERCVKLRRLDLSYLCHVSPLVFIRMMPHLNCILVLNLKMTEITDQVLQLIGKHCPDIRDLDVSMCPISNQGLYSLCYDAEEREVQCTKLIRLCLIGCMITTDALCFVLQKIPTLKELEHENTFRVFSAYSQIGINIKNILESTSKVFHLNHLTATNDSLNEESVDIAVTLCPFVSNVTISETIIHNESLYKFMQLENLCHIRLTNNENFTVDFYEGVLPLITVCGHRLLSLLLAKFTMIDIAAIGECCPRLRNLALSNIDTYEEILYPREHLFKDLTALEIWTEMQVETMNAVILRQLLFFCSNLRNLLISGSPALTDKLFAEVLGINQLKKLSRLTLESCANITRSTFENILNLNNEVVLIRIWSCFLVSKMDDVFLQNKIKNENCDVYLEWFAWSG